MAKRKINRKPKKNYRRYKSTNKYYPIVYCLKEDTTVAVSRIPVFIKKDKAGRVQVEKTNTRHWQKQDSVFLTESHIIDFDRLIVGAQAVCPHCKGDIDFRLWPSDSKPGITGGVTFDKEGNIKEFTEAQNPKAEPTP
jgi:hypothetical protein